MKELKDRGSNICIYNNNKNQALSH